MENFDIKKKRAELRRKVKRRSLIKSISLFSLLFFTIILSLKVFSKEEAFINSKVITSGISSSQKIICIDPGHGDWDSGSIGYSNSYEKDIVLNISLLLGNLLEENNYKVVYTRTNDYLPHIKTANESLKERLKISETFKADLFISIHCNSDYNSKDTKGVETWYNPTIEDSLDIATIIQSNLASLNYTEDRGLKTYYKKEDGFAVLEKNSAAPVLVELGFLSNYLDEKLLTSENGQTLLAESLAKSVSEYFSNEN